MSEPAQVLIRAAMEALAPVRVELRRRGWDAELYAEATLGVDPLYVAVRIRLPELALPVEAGQRTCDVCLGEGQVPGFAIEDDPEECAACSGKGLVG